MLLFRSKEHAQGWCRRQGMPLGEVVPFEQVFALSKLWYRDRLSLDYSGRSHEQAHHIFEQVGLVSDFWRFDQHHP